MKKAIILVLLLMILMTSAIAIAEIEVECVETSHHHNPKCHPPPIPEFTTIGAGIALIGAGIIITRKKKN